MGYATALEETEGGPGALRDTVEGVGASIAGELG